MGLQWEGEENARCTHPVCGSPHVQTLCSSHPCTSPEPGGSGGDTTPLTQPLPSKVSSPHPTKGIWLQSSLCSGISVLGWIQGGSPSSTKKGYGMIKRPKFLTWSCSWDKCDQHREESGRAWCCTHTRMHESSPLRGSWHPRHFVLIAELSLPCPNYLQEQQCLLFCPLPSGAGCSFTLQRNRCASQSQTVWSQGSQAQADCTSYLGGDILLCIHVCAQSKVLHVRGFLFAFVRKVEHLLGSRALLFMEGETRST